MSHDHGGGARAGARHQRALALTFALVTGFLVVEAVAGFLTNSLALLSDAGHMLTDAVGLGMALAAIRAASHAVADGRRTYGLYRLEILAALVNSLLMFGVAAYVLIEGIGRFQHPPAVLSGPMLAVAVVGLMVNVTGWWLLRAGAGESLNLEGAMLEVLGDLLGSIGVIVAAIVLITTGWPYADPLIAVGIGLFILPRAARLGWRALHVLVQLAPAGVDLAGVRSDLLGLDGVVDVHDVHVWTLTSEMDVASAHVVFRDQADSHSILDQAQEVLRERHRLTHATLQMEPESHRSCVEVGW